MRQLGAMLFAWIFIPLAMAASNRLSKQELAFVGKAIDDFISDFDHSIEKKNRQLLRMLGKMSVRTVEGEASAHELIESWMKGMKAAFEVRLNAVTEDLKERVLIECVDIPSPPSHRHLGQSSSETDLDDDDFGEGQCVLRKPHGQVSRPRRVVPGTRMRERIVIRDDLLGGPRSYPDLYSDDYTAGGWRHLDDDYRAGATRGSSSGRRRSNRYDDLYRKRELERERELRRLEARLQRLRGHRK